MNHDQAEQEIARIEELRKSIDKQAASISPRVASFHSSASYTLRQILKDSKALADSAIVGIHARTEE